MSDHNDAKFSLTVTFDNFTLVSGLKTAWGYSCFIETEHDTVLFDTGSNGSILLDNMKKINLSPQSVKKVVISHTHWDHLGGLSEFLKVNKNVTVYLPNSATDSEEKQIVSAGAQIERILESREIAPGIYSMGELEGAMPEQSLAIRSSKGLVLLTGCAHPGIIAILKRAKTLFPDEHTYLLMGGFHLKDHHPTEVDEIVGFIKDVGVKNVAPSHCTGETAIGIFHEQFQENFVKAGLGLTIGFE